MKELFKKYVDNVKKFFNYDYKEIIKKMVPQGNSININDEYNNVLKETSKYLIIMYLIMTVLKYAVKVCNYASLYKGMEHILKIAFEEMVLTELSSIIVLTFFLLIVPVCLYFYVKNYGSYKQKPWVYYFLIFYSVIAILKNAFVALFALKTLFSAFIFTILLICSYLLIALLYFTILKTSIDISIYAYDEWEKEMKSDDVITHVDTNIEHIEADKNLNPVELETVPLSENDYIKEEVVNNEQKESNNN